MVRVALLVIRPTRCVSLGGGVGVVEVRAVERGEGADGVAPVTIRRHEQRGHEAPKGQGAQQAWLALTERSTSASLALVR